jgi:hypothetical protein
LISFPNFERLTALPTVFRGKDVSMRTRTSKAVLLTFGSACFGAAFAFACGSDDSSGDCVDFSGHYLISGSCTDGSSLQSESDVTQSGCRLTINNDDGTVEQVSASGKEVPYTVSEEDVTGNCTLTLEGTSVSVACNS